MLNLKRITLVLCSALLMLAIAGCGAEQSKDNTEAGSETNVGTSSEVIPLTDEESGILEEMGSDVNVITDEDYSSTVIELQAHPGRFSGQVYQLEGVYTTSTVNGVETPFIYRTLVHEGEETTCGLPLKYLEKEIPDGAWARITAIIGTEDYGGETCTVMEVVAAETLAQAGQSQLQWDGVGHQH